jgi:hypothetical protein
MPRPSRWPRVVKVGLAAAQEDALRALSIREGIPMSDLARRAITREIERLHCAAARDQEIKSCQT